MSNEEPSRSPGRALDNLEKFQDFVILLLQWFSVFGRDLPWRKDYVPYRIWVAEVMLSQTQVQRVIPYYLHFLERFPDVVALASASREEVLLSWEGLGYYRRAHNLHEAAQIVVERFGGYIPEDFDTLRSLPGIGLYIASAILGIGYNRPLLALDTNAKRVFTRFLKLSPSSLTSWGFVRTLSSLIPEGKARSLNQAIMDLGAMVCLPRKPQCQECPLERFCQWRIEGGREESGASRERVSLEVTIAVCLWKERVLLWRNSGRLFPGLWGLPWREEKEASEDLKGWVNALGKEYGFIPSTFWKCGIVRHAYTKYRIRAQVVGVTVKRRGIPLRGDASWILKRDLSRYPLPSLYRKVLRVFLSGGCGRDGSGLASAEESHSGGQNETLYG